MDGTRIAIHADTHDGGDGCSKSQLHWIGCLERNKKYLKDDSVVAIRPRSILTQSG
jgi:hypothetical protein